MEHFVLVLIKHNVVHGSMEDAWHKNAWVKHQGMFEIKFCLSFLCRLSFYIVLPFHFVIIHFKPMYTDVSVSQRNGTKCYIKTIESIQFIDFDLQLNVANQCNVTEASNVIEHERICNHCFTCNGNVNPVLFQCILICFAVGIWQFRASSVHVSCM